MRRLYLILGDQLDRDSVIFDQFDATQDSLWMAEVEQESNHVWSHKQRIALFLSAMRHFAVELKQAKLPLKYWRIDEHDHQSLAGALMQTLGGNQPQAVYMVRPGDYRVLAEIKRCCKQHDIPLQLLKDQHFLSTPNEFRDWAKGRKQLRMEYWYRDLRKRYQILIEQDGKPTGGKWNYDQQNRKSFGKTAPENLPIFPDFEQDEITTKVIKEVNQRFNDHPGELKTLRWAVTPKQAEALLQNFLDHALANFGDYQDAMWTKQPFLYHSLLSAALNLKLIHPLVVIEQAAQRYQSENAPLAAVEGFIRQILGWREYVRGLYWHYMPQWNDWNALKANQDLPSFYWTGNTDMTCLSESIGQTLQHGYAHHIQRLMVTGLFSLLYGVDPRQIHEWYLAVYVDAVEWVELPNTIGMSQYADGGIMASKPYIASGNYINKMSNYCKNCRYKPSLATGEKACPFTLLFWDFLDRHEATFNNHPRMAFMLKNLQKKSEDEREAIRLQAKEYREKLTNNKG